MGPGAGCCGPSSGAGGCGSGGQPAPLPGPPAEPRRNPGFSARTCHCAGTEWEQGPAGHLTAAWFLPGVKSRRSQRPPGEPRHHQGLDQQHPTSARARAPRYRWSPPGAKGCQLQRLAPAAAPAAGTRVRGAGRTGALQPPPREAAAERSDTCAPTRASPRACPHTYVPHTRTHVPTRTRVQALQTSRWRRSDAERRSSIPQPPAPQPAAPSRRAGDGGRGGTAPAAGPGRTPPHLPAGMSWHSTQWHNVVGRCLQNHQRAQEIAGGSAISHCPRGLRHPVSHSWRVPGPTLPTVQLRAPFPAVPGPCCPPAGAGQPCRWVCRPAPGSPRSSKTSRSPKDGAVKYSAEPPAFITP